MKPKRPSKLNDILFIFISSFIVVVAWIGFNLYHIYVTSTISQDLQLELTPIDPNFDKQSIQDLQSRENVNPLFVSSQSASPTPQEQTPTAEPTPVPQISSTPSTIPSGIPSVAPSTVPSTAPSTAPQVSPSISPVTIQGQ